MSVRALGAVIGVALLAQPAAADESQADKPDASYFTDSGAMLFFWIPAIGTYVVDSYVKPNDSPLLFSSREGGNPSRRGSEVPGVALSAGGAAVVGLIALGDDPSRFHHAKGLAQSLATSGFIAVTAKRLFGRHRPDYDPASGADDGKRSFPSGHSTRALSTITYTALYLHHHGFDQWRKPGTLPWWEVASYVGLGALGVGLMGERVYHHRHHVGDVVAGGLLGSASSVAFFYYQERAFEKSKEKSPLDMPLPRRAFADPIAEREAATRMPAPDGPMLQLGGSF